MQHPYKKIVFILLYPKTLNTIYYAEELPVNSNKEH